MTLYSALGLPPDASDAEIKRAHRKAARKHHPDAGGDRDQFECVQHAYLVLRDPERRRRYDETGEHEDKVENPIADLATCIMPAFERAVQRPGLPLVQRDIIAETRAIMEEEHKQVTAKIADFQTEIQMVEVLLKRLQFDGEGTDVISAALNQRAAHFEQLLAETERDAGKFATAIAYLNHYGFDFMPAERADLLSGVFSVRVAQDRC